MLRLRQQVKKEEAKQEEKKVEEKKTEKIVLTRQNSSEKAGAKSIFSLQGQSNATKKAPQAAELRAQKGKLSFLTCAGS